MFIDKIGDPVIIDGNIFSTRKGYSKITKRERHLFLKEFAKTIKEPDEIYLEYQELANPENKYRKYTHRLCKKMFKYYDDNKAIMAVFEYQKNKTQGATIYNISDKLTLDNKREGVLIYKKG